MLDNKVLEMNPGEALLEAPIGDLIQKIAISIAESQLRLDQMAVRVATMLSDTKVDFSKADGTKITKSLLELGFVPPFYHFTETEIDVSMTIQLKVSEDLKIGGEASIGEKGGGKEVAAAKRIVPFGVSITAEYQRKYDFNMEGSSHVKTKLVSVPPPNVFIETIKENARAGGSMASASE